MKVLQTLKSDFSQTRLVSVPAPSIEQNQIKLKIERFAFTANNITYAVAGDFLKYWSFFPALNEDGSDASATWGQIPVWGFARVINSNANDIAEGDRFFGYFPPSEYCVMTPTSLQHQTFIDASTHRSHLPPTYNRYRKVTGDVKPQEENEQSLLFPLFGTAHTIDDLCETKNWYEAEDALVLSASSKTSIGVAYAMRANSDSPNSIGLTSQKNKPVVEQLGLYDAVYSYDEIGQLDAQRPCCIIDMSGNKALLANLHRHYGENMRRTLSVGATHWSSLERNSDIIEERTEQFFAPSQFEEMAKRLGAQEFQAQLSKFIGESCVKTREWLQCKELGSIDELNDVYPKICQGTMDSNLGIMVVPSKEI